MHHQSAALEPGHSLIYKLGFYHEQIGLVLILTAMAAHVYIYRKDMFSWLELLIKRAIKILHSGR